VVYAQVDRLPRAAPSLLLLTPQHHAAVTNPCSGQRATLHTGGTQDIKQAHGFAHALPLRQKLCQCCACTLSVSQDAAAPSAEQTQQTAPTNNIAQLSGSHHTICCSS
jgi:hypothetical protein